MRCSDTKCGERSFHIPPISHPEAVVLQNDEVSEELRRRRKELSLVQHSNLRSLSVLVKKAENALAHSDLVAAFKRADDEVSLTCAWGVELNWTRLVIRAVLSAVRSDVETCRVQEGQGGAAQSPRQAPRRCSPLGRFWPFMTWPASDTFLSAYVCHMIWCALWYLFEIIKSIPRLDRRALYTNIIICCKCNSTNYVDMGKVTKITIFKWQQYWEFRYLKSLLWSVRINVSFAFKI